MQVRDPQLIKELRQERGLTQSQMAALCKCSQGAISAIETGKLDNISLDLGGYIAKWLERRPRELFDQFDDSELAERDMANSVRNAGRIKRARTVVAA